MTIRVLLADDQPLLRAGFKVLIDSQPDLQVVGEASDGREAVELAKATQADVVLMDIRMPGTDGLTATRLITEDEDLAGVHILILTTFELDEYVFQALRYGASGFLGKSAQADELLAAIRVISRGEALLSPAATSALIARYLTFPDHADLPQPPQLTALTNREREVVAHLVLSPATAKTHVNRAMVKLGARDRAQLVVTAYQSGLVRPLPPDAAGRFRSPGTGQVAG
jgi:DNA-binding NarL/FixJ family response regulator